LSKSDVKDEKLRATRRLVKKWQAERAKYPEVAPPPLEK
jgi:hypothetical protein